MNIISAKSASLSQVQIANRIQDLKKLGEDKIHLGSYGFGSDPRALTTNPSQTMLVKTGSCELSRVPGGPRYLVTYGLITCVAIIAYNKRSRTGFLAHCYAPHNALDVLEVLANVGHMDKIAVFCGNETHIKFESDTHKLIEGYLSSSKVELSGRNTNPAPSLGGRKVGIDVMTGEVFIPQNRLKELSRHCRFQSAAPVSFLEELRR